MRPARKELIKTKKTFERLRLYHRSSSCQDFSMVTMRQNLLVVRAKSPSSKVPLPLGWGEGLARHSELRHTFFLFSPTLRVPRFFGVLLSSILYSAPQLRFLCRTPISISQIYGPRRCV